jgi:hypothetical protein
MVLEAIGTFLGGALSIGIPIYAWLKFPGYVDNAQSVLFGWVKGWSRFTDRRYVKKNIESLINSYGEEDIGYDMDSRFRIEWETNTDVDSFIQDDEVVLCLSDSENQPKNVAKATIEYVRKSVIPESRKYLPPEISKSIDYCISLNILQADSKDARRSLYDSVIMPELEDDDGRVSEDNPTREKFEKVESTRKGGLLGPILIEEYSTLRGYGIPDEVIREECSDYLDFLVEIATKNKGEDVPLDFEGEHFDVQIGLVGKRPPATDYYIQRCEDSLQEHHSVYTLGVGDYTVKWTKEIVEELSGSEYVRERTITKYNLPEDSYFGDSTVAICGKFVSRDMSGKTPDTDEETEVAVDESASVEGVDA